jgi:hypothetical protein
MLEDRIEARIRDDHRKLATEGKLLSRSQLGACCQTFRSQFGPDVLATLDGGAPAVTWTSKASKPSKPWPTRIADFPRTHMHV